jgi:hypothetical protein
VLYIVGLERIVLDCICIVVCGLEIIVLGGNCAVGFRS